MGRGFNSFRVEAISKQICYCPCIVVVIPDLFYCSIMKILANVTNDIGKFTLLNKIIAFQHEV